MVAARELRRAADMLEATGGEVGQFRVHYHYLDSMLEALQRRDGRDSGGSDGATDLLAV